MTDSDAISIFAPMALSAGLVVATVVIHMVGLIGLMATLQNRSHHIRPFSSMFRQGLFIILIVLGLVVIHAVEIWLYTGVYLWLGEFSGIEEALYYSIATFTTAGFGDVVQNSPWRLVGAVESFNGFLLIGWSTAFLVSVISRLRSMETAWIEALRQKAD